MIILTIRTDNPEAEIGLYRDQIQLAYETWQAHRQLAETLHKKIDELLKRQSISLMDVQGIIVFQGPGSFTGLRIGLTVGNTLAYAQNLPIVAKQHDNWVATGIDALLAGYDDKVALPYYGAEANITVQKK